MCKTASSLTLRIACAFACAAATVASAPAAAQTSVDVERMFWACDYAATTRGVSATPVAACSAAYDELKAARFGGDFDALVTWWRSNKEAEHRRIGDAGEAAERTARR